MEPDLTEGNLKRQQPNTDDLCETQRPCASRLHIAPMESPHVWAHALVVCGLCHQDGLIEQHLVGAILERRFPSLAFHLHPSCASKRPIRWDSEFRLRSLVLHVSGFPTRSLIGRCKGNVRAGLQPMLLVPAIMVDRAHVIAEDEDIADKLMILSLEDYVTLNVIQAASSDKLSPSEVMTQIIAIYNQRLAEVETDQSLRIQLR